MSSQSRTSVPTLVAVASVVLLLIQVGAPVAAASIPQVAVPSGAAFQALAAASPSRVAFLEAQQRGLADLLLEESAGAHGTSGLLDLAGLALGARGATLGGLALPVQHLDRVDPVLARAHVLLGAVTEPRQVSTASPGEPDLPGLLMRLGSSPAQADAIDLDLMDLTSGERAAIGDVLEGVLELAAAQRRGAGVQDAQLDLLLAGQELADALSGLCQQTAEQPVGVDVPPEVPDPPDPGDPPAPPEVPPVPEDGPVVIDLDCGDDEYTIDRLLVIDAGGDDIYLNNAGGAGVTVSDPRRPVAALFDLAGDDQYVSGRSNGVNGGADGPSAGFLFDASGDDRYVGGSRGVNGGASRGGSGMLVDLAGTDHYEGFSEGVNGGAKEGRGLLLDAGGRDRYIGEDMGVNGGAFGGVGMLLDLAETDRYVGGSYGVNGGAFGGIGLLLDGDGFDHYTAGGRGVNGGGVEAGIGILLDRVGDDIYRAGDQGVNGGAGPLGVGLLIDRSGLDTYDAGTEGANGGGFGGAGLLFDRNGDDIYTAGAFAGNGGATLGLGLLLDGDGLDLFSDTDPDELVTQKGIVGAQIDVTRVVPWDQLALADLVVPDGTGLRPGESVAFAGTLTAEVPVRFFVADDEGEMLTVEPTSFGGLGEGIYYSPGEPIAITASYAPDLTAQIGERRITFRAADAAWGEELFAYGIRGPVSVGRDELTIVEDPLNPPIVWAGDPFTLDFTVTTGFFDDVVVDIVLEDDAANFRAVRQVVPTPAGTPVSFDLTVDDAADIEPEVTILQTSVFDAADLTASLVSIRDLPAPQPIFSFAPLAPQAGQAITFTDASLAGGFGVGDIDHAVVAWSWDFGGGVTSTATNPTHAYTLAITHAVRLTVTQDDGQQASTTRSVLVLPGPAARMDVVNQPLVQTAGATADVVYTARLFDEFDNEITPVDSETEIDWAIAPAAGGSFDENVLTPSNIARSSYTVTGTLRRNTLVADSVAFGIDPAAPFRIVILNGDLTQTAGSTSDVTYTANIFDEFDNLVPQDASTHITWSLSSPDGGMFVSNVLSPSDRAREYVVTATLDANPTVKETAGFTIIPGPIARLNIDTGNVEQTAGETAPVTFAASAFDAFDNPVVVNSATDLRWSRGNAAIGTFGANVFSPTNTAGISTITARLDPLLFPNLAVSAVASFEIVPGPIASIVITTPDLVREAGDLTTLSYLAISFDAFDNLVVTDSATHYVWSIAPAAGAFTANMLHPLDVIGAFTVTAALAEDAGIVDTAAYRTVDTTPPTITLFPLAEDAEQNHFVVFDADVYDLHGVVRATWKHGSDVLAVVPLPAPQSQPLQLVTFFTQPGETSITLVAEDIAGNVIDRAITFDVVPSDALPPQTSDPGQTPAEPAPDAGPTPGTTPGGDGGAGPVPDVVSVVATPSGVSGTDFTVSIAAPSAVRVSVRTPDERVALEMQLSRGASIRVTLAVLQGPPANAPPLETHTATQYFDFSAISSDGSPAPLTNTVIRFTVPDSVLKAAGVTLDQVVLFHWTGSYWEDLPTFYEGFSNGEHHFRAESRRLSPFVIALVASGGDKEEAQAEEPEDVGASLIALRVRDGYRVNLTAPSTSRHIRVAAEDGAFNIDVELPGDGQHRLWVEVLDARPADTPAIDADLARFFAIELFGPDGLPVEALSAALETTMKRTDIAASGGDPSQLVIVHAEGNRWVALDTEVDPINGHVLVRADLEHFSVYGVVLDTEEPRVGLSEAPPAILDEPYTFQLVASDNVAVRTVKVIVEGAKVPLQLAAPYGFVLDPVDLGPGFTQLTFIATDAAGNQAASRWTVEVEGYETLTPNALPDASDDTEAATTEGAGGVNVVGIVIIGLILVCGAGAAMWYAMRKKGETVVATAENVPTSA